MVAPMPPVIQRIEDDAGGTREWVPIEDGLRESAASWRKMLRDLKGQGLRDGPRLTVGDRALWFWSALGQVYPDNFHQRCWFHKTDNVLVALQKSSPSKAKADVQAIWRALSAPTSVS